jgi:hypothetical protein
MYMVRLDEDGLWCSDGLFREMTGRFGRTRSNGMAALEFACEGGTDRCWLLANGNEVTEGVVVDECCEGDTWIAKTRSE